MTGPTSENGYIALNADGLGNLGAYVYSTYYTGPYLLPGTTLSNITGFSSDASVFGGYAGTSAGGNRPFFVLKDQSKTCDMDPTGAYEQGGPTFAYGMDLTGTLMVGATIIRNPALNLGAARGFGRRSLDWHRSPTNCADAVTWNSLGTLPGFTSPAWLTGVPQDGADAKAVRQTPSGYVVVGSATDQNGNPQATRSNLYNGAKSIAQLLVNSGAGTRDFTSLTEAVGVSDDGTQITGNGQPQNAWHAVLPLPTQPKIDVSALPAAGGTVSGGGAFPAGSSQTVTATPNVGYAFVSWKEFGAVVPPVAPYASVVSTSPSFTFQLNAYRRLVANFTAQNYSIAVSASPGADGTVGGACSACPAGSSQTVTATPNSGYVFAN